MNDLKERKKLDSAQENEGSGLVCRFSTSVLCLYAKVGGRSGYADGSIQAVRCSVGSFSGDEDDDDDIVIVKQPSALKRARGSAAAAEKSSDPKRAKKVDPKKAVKSSAMEPSLESILIIRLKTLESMFAAAVNSNESRFSGFEVSFGGSTFTLSPNLQAAFERTLLALDSTCIPTSALPASPTPRLALCLPAA